MAKSAQRVKAEELAAAVNKVVGGKALRFGSDIDFAVTYMTSGLLPVDIALTGGIPSGRFIMLTGDYSTLKSYIGLHAIAQRQKAGGTAALIDTEHAFDPEWARSIGVDVESLIIERPATGEMAVDIAETLTRGGVDLIVFDSVAASLPQSERDKRMAEEKMQPARTAALMSAACRKLTAANDTTSYIWINQLREKIGITFGSSESIPGGKALPYYSSYILNIRKVGKITKDVKIYTGEKWATTKEQTGVKFKLQIQKSKLSKPFREIWFDWDLDNNQIDMVGFLVMQGIEIGLVKVKGNSWSYGAVKSVGQKNFRKRLGATPTALAALEVAVRGHYGLPVIPVAKPRLKRLARK